MSDFSTPDQLALAQDLYDALYEQHAWRAAGPVTAIDGGRLAHTEDLEGRVFETLTDFVLNVPPDHADDVKALAPLARTGPPGVLIFDVLLGGWVLTYPTSVEEAMRAADMLTDRGRHDPTQVVIIVPFPVAPPEGSSDRYPTE